MGIMNYDFNKLSYKIMDSGFNTLLLFASSFSLNKLNVLDGRKEPNYKDYLQFFVIDTLYKMTDHKYDMSISNDVGNNMLINELSMVFALKSLYDIAIDEKSVQSSIISNGVTIGGLGVIKKTLDYVQNK